MENAQLQRAVLTGANLYQARLQHADLHNASLEDAHLREACLDDANLHRAVLASANLQRASLRSARLENVELTSARMRHVCVYNAWLDRTRLYWEQIDGRIGDELVAEGIFDRLAEGGAVEDSLDQASAYEKCAAAYGEARRAYLALRRNFADMGDHHATMKAYLEERRMEKLATFYQARADLNNQRWRPAARRFGQAALDEIAELTCGYGVSILRVIATLGLVYVAVILVYGFSGSIQYDPPLAEKPDKLSGFLDLARLSLGAMTTLGADGLKIQRGPMELLAGLEAFLGIGLTGLLGFVLGNRTRRL